MSFVFDLLINPLVFIYDLVFGIAYKICNVFNTSNVSDYALPIIAVSIMVNILTFPLYKRADKIQEEEREKQKSMKSMVDHINKSFKGDERFMMLTTYYRQMNYKPIYAVRASLSLLLQIPFFTAAYRFFTTARFLSGQGAFLLSVNPTNFIFNNLAKPDGLFMIGSFTINILPIIMTLINFVSSAIYTKDFDIKDRVQPFILAIAFLVILYNSPSGLVIYWTMNNVIALVKIVAFKLAKKKNDIKDDDKKNTINENELKTFNQITFVSAFSIATFAGLLIPTQIITSAPYDFVGWYSTFWPYIEYTSSTYLGIAVWAIVFYFMSSNKVKKNYAIVLFGINLVVIINYFLFYVDFGYLSPLLRYDDNEVKFNISIVLINLLVVLAIFVLVFKININKFRMTFRYISTICLLTFVILAIINILLTKNQLEFKGEKTQYSSSVVLEQVDKNLIEALQGEGQELTFEDYEKMSNNELFPVNPVFKLSKKGKNVILLMIDKYQGVYFPYVLNEKPILKDQFKGFTYYPNTISYGLNTLYGTPGLFGGYEYIPIEYDRRNSDDISNDDNLIKNNQNEALKVLPKMFHDEGYDCVVSNVPYENFGERTNSIYDYNDPKDFIATRSNLTGKTMSKSVLYNIDTSMEGLKRNFIYYTLMKLSPIILQKQIYDNGRYLSAADKNTMLYDMSFIGAFAVLERLSDYTEIVDDDSNNFFMMDNAAVHQPNMLSYPEFMPLPYTESIANKDFYDENGNKFEGSKTYFTSTVGATLLLGKFMDYLKENGVYDNTRIVIVADHGFPTDRWEKYYITTKLNEPKQKTIHNIDFTGRNSTYILNEDGDDITFSLLGLNPILLYKDFNDNEELNTSYEFMTNADSPSLCIKDLLNSTINPYTGNDINMDYKNKNINYITLGHHWQAQNRREDKKYQYPGELWATIHDDIFNNDNWGITYSID